jgi:diguanylate cyclase (GGDEF)-like protein
VNVSLLCFETAGAGGWITAVSAIAVAVRRSRQCATLRDRARTDVCTGLLTKAEWRREAEAELGRARRTAAPVAVAMIDIDHFKHVNDRYGHLAGDQVLSSVAAMIRSELRGYDLAGRFGGDEIVVLFPGTTAIAAGRIAQRLCGRIASAGIEVGHDVCLTVAVSVGISEYTEDDAGLDALLASADSALYEAKRAGRGRVRVSGSSSRVP